MTGWVVQLWAAVRVAEPWSGANVAGGVMLLAVALGALAAALFVTLRR